MIEFEGKTYRIDLKKVFELVLCSEKNTRKEEEITDGYEVVENVDDNGEPSKELSLVTKMVREIKTPTDTQNDGIRYDFLKMLIYELFEIEDDENITFGSQICINTLIHEGILIEVN